MQAYLKSLAVNVTQTYHRVFRTDFETAWQSSLEALKETQLETSNHEGGLLQTHWMDNTAERNFVDSFGNAGANLKAQYRVRVSLAKGYFNGLPSVRLSIEKEQLVERDVLEGWVPIPTDGIDEHTLLYRIGRIIVLNGKLAEAEAARNKKALEKTGF